MKTIGLTNENNRIVEMSESEYAELRHLYEAVEKKSGLPSFIRPFSESIQEFDFSTVFGVIRVFYTNLFYINQLQNFIDEMKEQINV